MFVSYNSNIGVVVEKIPDKPSATQFSKMMRYCDAGLRRTQKRALELLFSCYRRFQFSNELERVNSADLSR